MLTYFSGLFEIEVKGVHDQSIYTPSTILTLTICDQYFKEKGEYCKIRMKLILALSLFLGYVTCQTIHGHELKVLAQSQFNGFDHDHNGILEMAEFEASVHGTDTNGDGNVTCAEYAAATSQPHALALEIFHHYDQDGDCIMSHADALATLRQIDQNGDGTVNEHEFEHYYTQIMKHLGHIPHGHNGR
ncbi:uncharacterized protein [Mytilus edulis]|uniref:uncharacterized protein n=1 Tax=Mytilus edulis TaxID=6550 RepID=UPI0039F01BF4